MKQDAELMELISKDFTPAEGRGWSLDVVDISEAEARQGREFAIQILKIPPNSPELQHQKAEDAVPFLYRRGERMPTMSAGYSMRRRHLPFMRQARGDVLLTGLGIGMVANAASRLDTVSSVTVIELDKHLARMIRPQLLPGIKVEVADAWAWTPRNGAAYDVIWHDIWSQLNVPVVYPEHLRIMARYAAWLKPEGWQSCFEHEQIVRMAREAGLTSPGPDVPNQTV